jgi:hypothetical protein
MGSLDSNKVQYLIKNLQNLLKLEIKLGHEKMRNNAEVAHSQCSLRENPKFCKILDLRKIHLKEMFDYFIHKIYTIVFMA